MDIISLVNMKGGVAKTTLAINLADCLASRHGCSVLVVDVDPQFNATQCLMSAEDYLDHCRQGNDTIVAVIDGHPRPVAGSATYPGVDEPRDVRDIDVVNIKPRLDLLPGSLELYRVEMASGQGREFRLANYLKALAEDGEYDYVIIDTPPTPSIWMTSALIGSNYYLIPVRADPLSLTGIDLLHSIIKQTVSNFGLKIACAGLVLTITEENTVVFRNAKSNLEIDTNWKDHLYPMNFPKRTQIARTQISQELILDGANDDAKISITQITNELLERTL